LIEAAKAAQPEAPADKMDVDLDEMDEELFGNELLEQIKTTTTTTTTTTTATNDDEASYVCMTHSDLSFTKPTLYRKASQQSDVFQPAPAAPQLSQVDIEPARMVDDAESSSDSDSDSGDSSSSSSSSWALLKAYFCRFL